MNESIHKYVLMELVDCWTIAWLPPESGARLINPAVENPEAFLKGVPINLVKA